MPAYVYILRDKSNKLYIGSTTDLKRRLTQHHDGHTQTTRNMISPILVLSQQYDSLSDARRIERRLKKLKRKDYLEKIIQEGTIQIR